MNELTAQAMGMNVRHEAPAVIPPLEEVSLTVLLEQLERMEDKIDTLLRWKDELEAELKPMLENLANGGIMGIMGSLLKR